MSSPYPGGFNIPAKPQRPGFDPGSFGATGHPQDMFTAFLNWMGQQQSPQATSPEQNRAPLGSPQPNFHFETDGGQGQSQQPHEKLGDLLTQLRNDPQGDANKAYIPGQQGPGNPFSNGFFKTADQRKQIETDRLGTPGFSSMTPATQASALGTHQPVSGMHEMNAAGASPLPFQLNPATLAMIHQQPNPATTASNAAVDPHWGNIFGQIATPNLGQIAKTYGKQKKSPMFPQDNASSMFR